MSMQSSFALRGRNPDVLTCIANLSNDEVFTPPEFANLMLDTLAEAWAEANGGVSIWANPEVKFLDPFTKSGVFLREITSRLVVGLEKEIPDLQERVEHILGKQVYGIAITNLTSLLARRSLYCSKFANGKYSVAKSFPTEQGNVWFERTEHTWVSGRCRFCGASQVTLDRAAEFETHASAFIHTKDIKARIAEIFGGDMRFDVVIGNPPYQTSGGGGGSNDSPIYHHFVQNAIGLDPRFVVMVTPSRWFAGGRGLGEFRETMLNSKHLRTISDYPVASEVFPGVEIKGGVSYFLYDTENAGLCSVTTTRGNEVSGPDLRDLAEFDVFIRDRRASDILRKVLAAGEPSVMGILTADTPFGLATNFTGFRDKHFQGDVAYHYNKRGKRLVGYMRRDDVPRGTDKIDKWKVLLPKAGSDGGQKIPDAVLGKPMIAGPNSVCSQTYLFLSVDSEAEAKSVNSYVQTKFFRFLVSLRKITQDALRPMYQWVPQQDWSKTWSDSALYEKYKLTEEERAFVEKMIRPMDFDDNSDRRR